MFRNNEDLTSDWEEISKEEASTHTADDPSDDWIDVPADEERPLITNTYFPKTPKYILCFRGANHPHDALRDGIQPRQIGPIQYEFGAIQTMTAIPVAPLLEVAAYFPEGLLGFTTIDVMLIPLPEENDEIFKSRIENAATKINESNATFVNTSSCQKLDEIATVSSDEHAYKLSGVIWSHELASHGINRENIVATMKCERSIGNFQVTDLTWQDESVVNPDFVHLGYKKRLETYLENFLNKKTSFFNNCDIRLPSKSYKGFFAKGKNYAAVHADGLYQHYLSMVQSYCDDNKIYLRHGDNIRLMDQYQDPHFDVTEFCKTLQATDVYLKAFKQYCDQFDGDFSVDNSSDLEQLMLLQDISHPDQVNDETKKFLAKDFCMRKISAYADEAEAAYQAFIAPQSTEEKLSQIRFNDLNALFRDASLNIIAILNITSNMTNSERTKILARQAGINPALDREQFLSLTTLQCPQIYPSWYDLADDQKIIFPFAFLKNSDLMTMLFTEGGNNMFSTLQTKIKAGAITEEQYTLWLLRWIVEIAVFMNKEPTGSVFLTQRVAESIFALKQELDKLWNNSEHDVLDAYLQVRQTWLGVDNRFLAHIGALLQFYKNDEGVILQQWFDALTPSQRCDYTETYQKFVQTTQQTPKQSLEMLNALLAANCSVQEACAIYSMISTQAYTLYFSNTTDSPLSFQALCTEENIGLCVAAYRASKNVPALQLNKQGEVVFKETPGILNRLSIR